MHILPGRIRIRIPELKNNPATAQELQVLVKETRGISEVQINPYTGSCLVFFDNAITAEVIVKEIQELLPQAAQNASRRSLQNKPVKAPGQPGSKLKQVITGGAILTLFWGLPQGGAAMSGPIPLPISSAALITAGYPVFRSGLSYFSKHKRPNFDFMVSALSLLSTLMGKGYLGLFTLWLANLSDYLQHLTFKTASNSFSNILIKKGNKISLLKDGKVRSVLPGDVSPGDLGVFVPGDCIPVEGEVVSGRAVVIPGEELSAGDPVEAGTVLERGRVVVKVHRVVEDTSLARLADILEDAMESPQAGSHLAVSYSERLLPVTFLSTAVVYAFTRNLQRTISVLLSGAPGPAGLAGPAALAASTGVAAGLGIAIRDSEALEKLSQIDVVFFNDKNLSHRKGDLHPALRRLEEEGYRVEDFDPMHLHDRPETSPLVERPALSPWDIVEEIHSQGLKVAWVSGPEHPELVENAEVNVMFLTGKEDTLADAQVLCYKNDPRQVYRLIRLSRNTMQTVKQNVYLVQGMNLLSQVLSALGVIGTVPAVGLTLLTTLVVVYNSGSSLIGIGNKEGSPFKSKGTIQGLAVDKGKCLLTKAMS
ncbi:MAG: HMA2 domain-containing protein [Bacillota bacterium]